MLSRQEADAYLHTVLEPSCVPWRKESFQIFGRTVEVPRQLFWFGEPGLNYRYTGLDHIGTGWPDWLNQLRNRVETVASSPFNFVLLNRYDNGAEHMGWHRDDEKGTSGCIASLSLGAARRFLYQPQPSDTNRSGSTPTSRAIELKHGSLCLFDPHMRHRLPPSRKVQQTRVNLTFRYLIPGKG